jgi:DNA mismatch repair protein MutS
VDRLFSRVGASDDLARGRSTFMVEMVETAAILNQAGARALVILDEIGRGTATYDGLSIAWAAAEHLHDVNGCRALFATHYHELTVLAERLSGVANATIRVKEWRDEIVFLHEVAPGAADRSYGIQVAKLAGLPRAAVKRAREVLARLESEGNGAGAAMEDLPLFAAMQEPEQAAYDGADEQAEALKTLRDEIAGLDPDGMTPRDALAELYRLKTLTG